MKYCLDSNTFIEASRRYYALNTFPIYWDWLLSKKDIIGSIDHVYDELTSFKSDKDELINWVKSHKDDIFDSSNTVDIQTTYAAIINSLYQNQTYNTVNRDNFISGADPWLIAYASVNNCILVTHEELAPLNSKKVKIPNICKEFDVEYMNTFEMLRREQALFK